MLKFTEKTIKHEEGSLEFLVSNLVKNWEKEMSHKLRKDQIRTINPEKYRFSVNGKGWNDVEDMLKVKKIFFNSITIE